MIKLKNWLFKRSAVLNGREFLDLFIEFIYLATIFLIPLWFSYWFPTYNIFEFNKLALFQVLVCLLLLATAGKLIFYWRHYQVLLGLLIKKYWLIPTIFIIGLGLSLFTSLDPVRSFYGSLERQDGIISYIFYFIWFILLTFNILTVSNTYHSSDLDISQDNIARRFKRIIITAVISSLLVSFYGLLQVLGIDFLTWSEAPFLTHRTISTFGQPNFLASWLLLVIPLSFYLFKLSQRFLFRFFYLLIIFVQLICLFLTGSRGGLIALVAGLILFLSYRFFSAARPFRKKISILIFSFLAIIIILGSFNYFSAGRLISLVNFKEGSVAARLDLYRAAAEAISQRPLWGYGPENNLEVFIKYYDVQWGVYAPVGQSADRAHNLILDLGLSLGLWGFLLYFILYCFIGHLIKENLTGKKSGALSGAIVLGIFMYLFSLLFSFTIVTGEIYLWLFLALLVALNVNQKGISGPFLAVGDYLKYSFKSKRTSWLIKLVGIFIFALLIFWRLIIVFNDLSADYYFARLYSALTRSDYFTSLVLYDYLKAQRPNPVNQQTYDNLFGDKLSEALPLASDLATKKVVSDKLAELDQSLPASSYSNLLVKAKINRVLENFIMAQAYIDQLIKLSPHWPPAYLEKGNIALAQNFTEEARAAYEVALLNLPSLTDRGLNESHRQEVLYYQYLIYQKIAEAFERQKNEAAAEKYFRLAYESNFNDFTLLKKIADTYYRRGNLDEAIKYNLRGWHRGPSDYHWPAALAELYGEKKNINQALYYLDKAINLAPDNQALLSLRAKYTNKNQ